MVFKLKDSSFVTENDNDGVLCNTLVIDESVLVMLCNSRGLNLGVAMIKDIS